jgi:hypothetical protein
MGGIFAKPTPATLAFAQIETLLIAVGARRIEGRGPRVRFDKDRRISTFHRPHPAKEAKCYQIEDARAFLIAMGVRP